MRFYTQQHQFYCGIDLHARQMYVYIPDAAGKTLVHRNIPATTEALERALARFAGSDLALAAECVFTWYWIADFCAERNIAFVLGDALYMRAIHGAKTKNDKVDSRRIAMLLRSGMLPQAYVYPAEMRSTRDLLRRREYFMHQQSELLEHIQNTNTQYNNAPFPKRIKNQANRVGIETRFTGPRVANPSRLTCSCWTPITDSSWTSKRRSFARHATTIRGKDMPVSLQFLHSIPGVGKVLALVILSEIQDVNQFPTVGNFISYARPVKCPRESAGKRSGSSHNKIGNAHLNRHILAEGIQRSGGAVPSQPCAGEEVP